MSLKTWKWAPSRDGPGCIARARAAESRRRPRPPHGRGVGARRRPGTAPARAHPPGGRGGGGRRALAPGPRRSGGAARRPDLAVGPPGRSRAGGRRPVRRLLQALAGGEQSSRPLRRRAPDGAQRARVAAHGGQGLDRLDAPPGPGVGRDLQPLPGAGLGDPLALRRRPLRHPHGLGPAQPGRHPSALPPGLGDRRPRHRARRRASPRRVPLGGAPREGRLGRGAHDGAAARRPPLPGPSGPEPVEPPDAPVGGGLRPAPGGLAPHLCRRTPGGPPRGHLARLGGLAAPASAPPAPRRRRPCGPGGGAGGGAVRGPPRPGRPRPPGRSAPGAPGGKRTLAWRGRADGRAQPAGPPPHVQRAGRHVRTRQPPGRADAGPGDGSPLPGRPGGRGENPLLAPPSPRLLAGDLPVRRRTLRLARGSSLPAAGRQPGAVGMPRGRSGSGGALAGGGTVATQDCRRGRRPRLRPGAQRLDPLRGRPRPSGCRHGPRDGRDGGGPVAPPAPHRPPELRVAGDLQGAPVPGDGLPPPVDQPEELVPPGAVDRRRATRRGALCEPAGEGPGPAPRRARHRPGRATPRARRRARPPDPAEGSRPQGGPAFPRAPADRRPGPPRAGPLHGARDRAEAENSPDRRSTESSTKRSSA